MSNYKLATYIRYGLFLENLLEKNNFDLIIFERKISVFEEKSKLNIMYLENNSNNYMSQIDSYMKKYDNILLILDESTSSDFLDNFEEIRGNLTVLNLYVGISSLGNKIKIDNFDISNFLNLGFNVYEPWDLQNLNKTLSKDGKKYIRLTDNELPENLLYFEDIGIIDKNILNEDELLSFVNNGFSGFRGTVITSGSLLPNTLRSLEILQSNGYSFDLFCMNNLSLIFRDDLKESLNRNDILIIILDQDYGSEYLNYLKEKFKKEGYDGLRIKFICPEYNKLNTVIQEYKFEQAGIDESNLVSIIQKIILN